MNEIQDGLHRLHAEARENKSTGTNNKKVEQQIAVAG